MAEHYFSKKQQSPLKLFAIQAHLRGVDIELFSASGVFAKKKVDLGTKVLIDYALIKKGSRILDLGCGYGPVGVTLAKLYPSCEVVMSDVNERAAKVARRNVKIHNLANIKVLCGDMFAKVKGNFDHILLNPPQTAGKKVCFAMIEQAREHLVPGGDLQIVARHQKGGKSLSEKMDEVFGNVEVVKRKSGYRVYRSVLRLP